MLSWLSMRGPVKPALQPLDGSASANAVQR
jgi:hypothetical protein